MNNNVVPLVCPECKSQNVQSEGFLHLCLDCGYKWEDAPNDDMGEMIIINQKKVLNLMFVLKAIQYGLIKNKSYHCSIRVNQQSVSIFPIFSKKENWMKKWLFGNSEQPLNMAQLMVKHSLKKLNITILTL